MFIKLTALDSTISRLNVNIIQWYYRKEEYTELALLNYDDIMTCIETPEEIDELLTNVGIVFSSIEPKKGLW